MTEVIATRPVNSASKTDLSSLIKQRFDAQCATARAEACKHIREAKRIRKISNFCSFTTISINVILSSAIFASMKQHIPEVALILGGFMALIPAGWGVVKETFKFSERLSEHSFAASKYQSFVNECGL